MALADVLTTVSSTRSGDRPRDDELDLFGLTHRGKVRADNQDHFLLATVHPQVVVHGTSLPAADALPLRGERLATVLLVADGVGGASAGGDASQLAVEAITRYVASTLRCYHVAGSRAENEFLEELHRATHEAHSAVKAEIERTGVRVMATTLTLGIVVWPWLYVVQVGDSRCYYYVNGELHQVTRDQTVAQDLVDMGVLPADRMRQSPYHHVLARAIGGPEATPEVTRLELRPGGIVLVCSDGLTKHVSDAEIAERLGRLESSDQVARELLDLALERGGSDNVTVVVGRARRERA